MPGSVASGTLCIIIYSYGTTVVYAVRRWPKRRYAAHTCIYLFLFILFGLFSDCQYTKHTTPKSKINDLRTEKDVRKWLWYNYRTLSVFPGRVRKNPRKKSIRTPDVSADSRTGHLPNTDLRRHRLGQSLGGVCPTQILLGHYIHYKSAI